MKIGLIFKVSYNFSIVLTAFGSESSVLAKIQARPSNKFGIAGPGPEYIRTGHRVGGDIAGTHWMIMYRIDYVRLSGASINDYLVSPSVFLEMIKYGQAAFWPPH
jgi:hypothetical protein